ncbi:MAG TPA: heat-inducible transcription repressor HrcA [Clostridiales bacterium]|nr:heat-inducible transcription repressor HrcA [Clostridiales bacterium]
MEIDERKYKILDSIIKRYLETGEPVGSRTISKDSGLNLSSATIRNEMADLEELGLIMQPHTSAGRIPTDQGYRLYVDRMMHNKYEEVEELKDLLIERVDKMDNLLRQIAKLLAVNTNYATVVSKPQYRTKKVKFIQITDIDPGQLLLVIVIEGNVVKNKIVRIDDCLDKETILKLNIIFNTFLQGLDLSEINMTIIHKMKQQAGDYNKLISDILDAIAGAIREEDEVEVYTSGATNILKYPELTDSKKAVDLIEAFEEKDKLVKLIESTSDGEKTGIEVMIGKESEVIAMQDCSVVTATYEIQEGVFGKIGIVGPKRMDYEKVVSSLNSIMKQLGDIFKNEESDE